MSTSNDGTEARPAQGGSHHSINTVALGAHDPLPDGPSVVLMRRLAEADPRGSVVELIVTGSDRNEVASTLADEAGNPIAWESALQVAAREAVSHGIERVHVVDRTEGRLEHAAATHAGDRGFPSVPLDDADPEDGVRGSDMRDGLGNAAPRKF